MAGLGDILSNIFGGGGTSTSSADILSILPLSVPPLSIPLLSIPGAPPPGTPTLSLSAPSAPASVATSLSAPPLSSLPLSTSTIPVPSASPSSPAFSTDPPAVSGDNGAVKTVSKVVTATAGASQSSVTVAGPSQHTSSFLQNKPLAGAVFALVGIVVLVLLFVTTTFFVRRRRRSRLDDAVSFDPGLISAAERSEKGHASTASLGSGRGMAAAPSEYYRQQYGQQQYEPQQYGQQYTQYGQQYTQQQYGMQPGMHGHHGERRTEYAYVPPMADAPAPAPQRNIPRSLMPAQSGPVPQEFGQDRRTSAEEAEFWARTLRVSND